MIGQNNIKHVIEKSLNRMPKFITITGSKGSGKRTVAKYIASKLGAIYCECGIKVDEIRDVIKTAYEIKETTVYCIADGDKMRGEAANALLKITEEPPEHAYFILTLESRDTLLDTLKSRACNLPLGAYTSKELKEYRNDVTPKILSIATTPYEVDMLMAYGDEFLKFVNLVVNNISKVKFSNAFKSGKSLALKGEDGYDLNIFFRAFIAICSDSVDSDVVHFSNSIIVTCNYLLQCYGASVNKQMLFDMWVFDIRKVWMQ